MRQANGVDVLGDPENVKQIGNILKTNVAACVAIGPYFLPQLGRLWVDMLGLYGAASNNVSTAVAEQGKLYMSLACGLPWTDLAFTCHFRACCDSNPEGPSLTNYQEGDPETGRDVHQASRRPGGHQRQPDPWSPGGRPGRLFAQCGACT